ncbi:helix-turn-helix domain-containing protein [Hymenobacter sp. BT175]|uniref:helix-turn-helix domain-containing protein n=1 Tax=Hymenobacter translucens TaxID=2886507 RepID=UPI001D0E2E22|nr:helix-turn-helix transcriptional regulator [Hymenobacter translucens]MCC2546136.1 helix-turn-helix domain-containing protein [Hymenobacter translucens]
MTLFPAAFSLTAAVRAHFGLSIQQLARYLGVSRGFVAHIEAGRRGLPAALAPRLLHLSCGLPPPLGQGPPASVPLPASPDPLPAPEALPAEATAPAPLRARLLTCRLRLLEAGRRLAEAERIAADREHRRRGLHQLQALPPPPAPAEAARYARWLTELDEDLAHNEPDPTARAVAHCLLKGRIAGLHAEITTLLKINQPD